jgi:hypothetical protein
MYERIYRDALAIKSGGKTEVAVGSDRIDIVVYGDESPDTLIEVKQASQLRTAIGQVRSYGARWQNPSSLRIHLLLSADRLQRNKEARRIDEHLSSGELEGISLTSEVIRADLPKCYSIAGHEFPLANPSAAISAHVASIREDFQLAGYLGPESSRFLAALRREPLPDSGDDARIKAIHAADALIADWLRWEHYHWVSAPLPITVGVCR